MSQEKRSSPRRVLHTRLRLGSEEAHGEMHLDARDLSTGGAFLESELLFEPGEVLELAFELPGGAGTVQGRGAVVWVSRGTDGPAGMGLAFQDLSEDDRALLAAFLDEVGAE